MSMDMFEVGDQVVYTKFIGNGSSLHIYRGTVIKMLDDDLVIFNTDSGTHVINKVGLHHLHQWEYRIAAVNTDKYLLTVACEEPK